MTRNEQMREARWLRTAGWTAPAIGRQLGVPESTVRNWYLGGDCEDCGTSITYMSKTVTPSRCVPCQLRRVEAPHGTHSRYQAGCSCEECRAANRAAGRALKGKPPPTHGYSGYNNYGCRCQKCRNSKSEHQRVYRVRKRAEVHSDG